MLTACQANAKPNTPPPLLDVVQVAGRKDIAIAPNGWCYFMAPLSIIDKLEIIATLARLA